MKLVSTHALRVALWFALAGFSHNALQAQAMSLPQCIETALADNKNLPGRKI